MAESVNTLCHVDFRVYDVAGVFSHSITSIFAFTTWQGVFTSSAASNFIFSTWCGVFSLTATSDYESLFIGLVLISEKNKV